VHHRTIQINQPTRCNNFSSLLLNVYAQLNMFRAFSRPSSGAQHWRGSLGGVAAYMPPHRGTNHVNVF